MGRAAKILAALGSGLAPPPPLEVDGVIVPPPAIDRRVRVLGDVRLPPIFMNNPLWTPGNGDVDAKGQQRMIRQQPAYELLTSLGCELGYCPGDADLNQATMWSIGGVPRPAGDVIPDKQDWSLQATNNDPPTRDACVALGALARRPDTYGTIARPHLPFVFDVENVSKWRVSPSDSVDAKINYLQGWLNAIQWVREGAGADQHVGIYGTDFIASAVLGSDPDPDPRLLIMLRRLALAMTFVTTTNYAWDPDVESYTGGAWFGEIAMGHTAIRRRWPEFAGGSTISFFNPFEQLYFPANDTEQARQLDGTPIPMSIWCPGITDAVQRGCGLWLWMGNGDPARVRPQLAYAAQYGFTPMGLAAQWLGR